MNGGINQLVDTYKGNPQPLQAKVQKAQQGQPPGEVPPDLEEAIALQKIAELRNSAQGQQAMQAGGAQQSVVDKLKQILGQAQMQGQPVMAASGGSIDQLMSNLGRHYAGGGIVAFTKGGNQGLSEEDKKAKQREEDRRALLSPLAAIGDIVQLPIAATYNLAADTGSGLERFLNRVGSALTGQEVNTQSDNQVGNKFRFSPTPFMDMLNKPSDREAAVQKAQAAASAPDLGSIRAQLNAADAARFAEKPAPKPPVPTANAPAAPRPTANAGIGGGPAKPATEPTDPMEAALRKSIMDALAKDPEEVRRKAIEANAKAMGLDALLKPGQERAASREAMIKQIQAERQPLWITALQNAGNKPRSNVAQILNQMATGVSTAKQGYSTQDLKFLEELDALHAINDKARIEGRYKDLAAGEAAVKDLISSQRQAEQSGTSLLNKQATLAQTKQIADDNRKSREIIAAANLEASKAKRLQDQNQFLANLEVKHTALLNNDKDYQGMIKQKQYIELQMTVTQDETKRAKLADQLQAQQAKMASYATNKVGGGMAGAANISQNAPTTGTKVIDFNKIK